MRDLKLAAAFVVAAMMIGCDQSDSTTPTAPAPGTTATPEKHDATATPVRLM